MTTVRVFQQPVKRAVQIILGLIFMVSSIYKIMTPLDFAHAIYNYQLLPGWMINPMAIVLPWVQLIAGSALVFRRGERGAGLLILLMMISFQAAVAVALFRGLSIVCGCFEPGGSPATWRTFGRDSVILILAAANFLSHLRQQPLDSRLKVES